MATGRLPDPNTAPLTAKGDLYTYSTVPARLAVGSNGDTLVADSSATTGLRWQADWNTGKNKIINGDFNINQRAFSSTTTSGTYGFDRWRLVRDSGGTATMSAQTFTPGAAPVTGYESTNFCRIVTTGQTATSTFTFFSQMIEDVRTFANQTATISFWAKAASGTPKISATLTQNFGSGGSPSASVNTYAGQTTISTSWARYSISIAVPSISGKTIGTTANTSSLELELWVSAGSDFNARTGSLGIQTGTFDIWGVQVEAGSVATPFTTATGTLAGELAACQRYYWRTTGQSATANDLMTGWANSTTSAVGVLRFPVTMRGAATGNFGAAGDFGFTWSAGTSTITGAAIDRISAESLNLRLTTTGLTTGQGGAIFLNSGTTKWIEASAEL